ncbi:profilin, required for normal timing of actin polymerization in response to thermal stress [Acarospora aff. strigata]|nr:profilin, required for normal timing of actin polymerization in response to thermal stress [Acarospora aff. strigata]
MSWQAYVDTSLVATGNLDKAAIFNSEGDSVWAHSPGFTVRSPVDSPNHLLALNAIFPLLETRCPLDFESLETYRKFEIWLSQATDPLTLHSQVAPSEIKEVVTAYKDKSDVKQVQSNGLRIGGDRYVVIKADDRSLYGKKGKEGIVIVKTTQAILVTHYPETVQPGAAAKTVEELGDYLTSVGY